MPAFTTIALVAGIAATTAGVVNSVVQSNEAGAAARANEAGQNALQAEAKAERERTQNQQAAQAARTRQRMLAASAPGAGQNPNVMTSPLGDAGAATTTATLGGKQQLGV
jgi:hypothetical protein